MTQTLSFSIFRKGDGKLGYVLTQSSSFSIVRGYIETFSFFNFWGNGNFDMY